MIGILLLQQFLQLTRFATAMKQRLLLPLLLLSLWACEPATKTVTYTTDPIEFTLMGPLFAGANTGQATWTPDLAAMAGEGATPEDIVEIRLQEAVFASQDSIPFAGWEEVVLQMVSDQSDMVNVAVLNPVPAGEASLSLTGAPESEVASIVKDGTCYLVTDVNLAEDIMDDVTFTGTFTFEVQVKE